MGNQNLQLPPELPTAVADHTQQIAAAERERPAKPRPGMTRADFEAKQLEKRQRQNEVKISIESSFPHKIRELLAGAQLHHFENLDAALVADCRKHGQAIAETRAELTSSVEMLTKVLNEAAESGDYLRVVGAAESVKLDKTAMTQQATRIWGDGIALATRIEAALQPLPAKLAAELEQVVADVRQKLTEIGSGLEAQQGYEFNRDAAETQFEYQARHRNLRSRAAGQKVEDARQTHRAAFEQKNGCVRGLETAKNYLHQVVLKSINS
jgi:hypothetical protein